MNVVAVVAVVAVLVVLSGCVSEPRANRTSTKESFIPGRDGGDMGGIGSLGSSAGGTGDTYSPNYYAGQFIDTHLQILGREISLAGISMQIISSSSMKDITGINAAGVCFYESNKIYLNEDYWKIYDYYQRQHLVFHELGHCSLNRDHNDALLNDRPVSIMHSSRFSRDAYSRVLQEFHEELFFKDTTPVIKALNEVYGSQSARASNGQYRSYFSSKTEEKKLHGNDFIF